MSQKGFSGSFIHPELQERGVMKYRLFRFIAVFLIFINFFNSQVLSAQEGTGLSGDFTVSNEIQPQNSSTGFWNREYLAYGLVAGTITGISIYGFTSWDWGNGRWGWAHEGGFGENTYSGGADKLGHLYTHYLLQRSFNNAFEWSLRDREKALMLSTGTAAIVGLLIEVGDGTSDEYGFSWEDMAADLAGIGIGALLEYFPVADEFVGLSFGYNMNSSGGGAKKRKATSVLNDYSGQKVMLNFRLAGFRAVGVDIPEFMRYIQFDLGYYTRGYTGYDDPGAKEKRHLFAGISLNFMEVVKDLYPEGERGSFSCVALQQPFKYFHVPVGYEADYSL